MTRPHWVGTTLLWCVLLAVGVVPGQLADAMTVHQPGAVAQSGSHPVPGAVFSAATGPPAPAVSGVTATATATTSRPIDSSADNSGDYATDAFGDPWDFNNAEDLIPMMRGLSPGISGLRIGAVSAINSVLAGTAAPNSYLTLAGTGPGVIPWGRDTRTYPINADRYTQLSMSMYSSVEMPMGVFYHLCVDGPTTCYNGSPFEAFAGWHVYTLDLRTTTVYYTANQRWSGQGSMIRLGFNPSSNAAFQIDWIRLGTAGSTGLNGAQPQPSVISPAFGGGSDYATTVRGWPWNLQSAGDVTLGGAGDAHYSAAGVRAKNVASKQIPRANDPHLQLPLPVPVDGSKYNHFSVQACYDGSFALTNVPGGGMNGRVIWQIAGESFPRNSQDFLVFPGCQLIDLDLSGAPGVVEDETDASLPGGLRGFSGHSIVALRFDPDEDPGTRYFSVGSIRLTAAQSGAGGFQIQFADRNFQPGTTADIWLDPTGSGTALRQIGRAIATTTGTNTFSWLGRDVANAVVPAGSYYVKIRLNNSLDHTAVYSSAPLVVGASPTKPGPVSGVQVMAGRATANVSWNPPTTGGAPLAYEVNASNGSSQTVAGSAHSATFVGLTNGTAQTFRVTAINGAGPSTVPSAVSATPSRAAGTYIPTVTPYRILDTRTSKAVTSGAVVTLQVTGGASGVPTTGVSAVAINVAAAGPTAAGFLTVWPTGLNRPAASNLNYQPGSTVANMVVARVGTGGRVSVFNALGSVQLVVDIVGYYSDGRTTGAGFFPLSPRRLLDTRSGLGAKRQSMGPNSTISVKVAGSPGIPASGVSAVVLNVAGVGPTVGGFLTVWPAGLARPNASSLNLSRGDTRANLVMVRVGSGGLINLYNSVGSVNIIADVVGWFGSAGDYSGAALLPLNPYRIFDSRPTSFTSLPPLPISAGSPRSVDLTGQGSGIPPGIATAVIANVTAVDPDTNGFVTLWPTGQPQPQASSINLKAGTVRPNLVSELLPADGGAQIAVSAGSTDIVVDVVAWYG